MFKYNNKVSFRSVAPPGSKHEHDPKAKKEMESWLKYNLEEKSAKRYAGIGFEGNNYSKQDNLIYNSRFFINFVVSNIPLLTLICLKKRKLLIKLSCFR